MRYDNTITTVNEASVVTISIPEFGKKKFKVHDTSVLHIIGNELMPSKDVNDDDECDIRDRQIYNIIRKNSNILPGDVVYVTPYYTHHAPIDGIRIVFINEIKPGKKDYELGPNKIYAKYDENLDGIPIYKALLEMNPHFFRSAEFRIAEHIKMPYNHLTKAIRDMIQNDKNMKDKLAEQKVRLLDLRSKDKESIIADAFKMYLEDTKKKSLSTNIPDNLKELFDLFGENWSDYMYCLYTLVYDDNLPPEIVYDLMTAYLDKNTINNTTSFNNTVLHMAVMEEIIDMIKYLTKTFNTLDYTIKNTDGETAYTLAFKHRHDSYDSWNIYKYLKKFTKVTAKKRILQKSIKVTKCSLDGDYLDTYNSLTSAVRSVHRSSSSELHKAIKETGIYHGFRWFLGSGLDE